MSGHSKWSTIKRKKEATDAARGKLFSKLGKTIAVAVKTGGGPNPDANARLKVAIDAAKAANMPKTNVDRILQKAAASTENIEEVTYEGFGPENTSLIIEVATDNRNRTSQELKQLLDRGGGSLGGPGSAAFNFVPKGMLVLTKHGDGEEQQLALIDAGVEDFEEGVDDLTAYVEPTKTMQVKAALEAQGVSVDSAQLIQKPLNAVHITDTAKAQKVFKLLDTLESHDDVQNVYCNADVPDEIAAKIDL